MFAALTLLALMDDGASQASGGFQPSGSPPSGGFQPSGSPPSGAPPSGGSQPSGSPPSGAPPSGGFQPSGSPPSGAPPSGGMKPGEFTNSTGGSNSSSSSSSSTWKIVGITSGSVIIAAVAIVAGFGIRKLVMKKYPQQTMKKLNDGDMQIQVTNP